MQSTNASPERQDALRSHAEAMSSYCETRKCLAQTIEQTFYQPPGTSTVSVACSCSTCSPEFILPPKVVEQSESEAKLLQLKFVRKTLAKKRNIPPYFLGNDQLLAKIAHAAPQTWNELKSLSGMGHARLFYWGKEILAITKT